MKRTNLKKISASMALVLIIVMCCLPVSGNIADKEIQTLASSIDDDIDWWPMFQHDLNHSGYSTSTGPETNNVLWSYQTDDEIDQLSPAVVDNKVYFGGGKSYFCIDANTGEEVWKTPIPSGGVYGSSSTVVNGKVYFGTCYNKGDVYCLNATDGSIIWRYQTSEITYEYVYSPAVYDGKVYIGIPNPEPGRMYCLDADTGDEIWISEPIASPGSPAVYDGRVFFGSKDFNVYCLDADNGTVIWKYKTEGEYVDTIHVSIYDGKIYANGYGLYCLDMDDGDLIWKFPTNTRIYATPCIVNGFAYLAVTASYAYCLDANTGEKIWDFETKYIVFSSPVYADGKIYICFNQKVFCLDAFTGEKIWDFIVGYYVTCPPAIADGKVYIGTNDGEMLCFGGVSDNNPPQTPDKINGPTTVLPNVGYSYNTSTFDVDGDQIYYRWYWGSEDYSDWIGPFNSNETMEINHTFYTYYNDFYVTIRVIAKDSNHARSDWTELRIYVQRDKTFENNMFLKLLNQFPLLNLLLQKLKILI